jgi:hypothetical protein
MSEEIKVKILLDSTNPYNKERVITVQVYTPRFLNAELNTHRNIAKNYSSGRAIGFPMTKHQKEPFIPPYVQTPSATMHGEKEVDIATYRSFAGNLHTIYQDILYVLAPFEHKVHKQHLNRYIEAFTMQTGVFTANEYAFDNLIKLRKSKYADPNIQIFASKLEDAISESKSIERFKHLPLTGDLDTDNYTDLELALISAGRIAKVSYNYAFDEAPENSLNRAKMLIEHEHKSPLCHQLFANMTANQEAITHMDFNGNQYSGTIRNWNQFRKYIWIGLEETEKKSYEVLDKC